MSETKPKRDSQDFKNVCVSKATHSAVKDYLDENNEAHIGKFFDNAAKERLSRLKNQSPFSKIDSQLLINNGWEKHSGMYWKWPNGKQTGIKGAIIIEYTGTKWLCDGIELTEQNYLEKIK